MLNRTAYSSSRSLRPRDLASSSSLARRRSVVVLAASSRRQRGAPLPDARRGCSSRSLRPRDRPALPPPRPAGNADSGQAAPRIWCPESAFPGGAASSGALRDPGALVLGGEVLAGDELGHRRGDVLHGAHLLVEVRDELVHVGVLEAGAQLT